jgi:hypothetical protein
MRPHPLDRRWAETRVDRKVRDAQRGAEQRAPRIARHPGVEGGEPDPGQPHAGLLLDPVPHGIDLVLELGLPVWETADYLLGWVEGAVRRHLVEFVGHEEIALRLANLTDDDRPDVDLTALTAAVRARLRRGEPVDDLAAVCRQLVATPVPG